MPYHLGQERQGCGTGLSSHHLAVAKSRVEELEAVVAEAESFLSVGQVRVVARRLGKIGQLAQGFLAAEQGLALGLGPLVDRSDPVAAPA